MTSSSADRSVRIQPSRAALEAVRRGDFDATVDPQPDDALGLPGQDIHALAATLGQRFSELPSLHATTERVEADLFFGDILERVHESFRRVIRYDRMGCALLSPDRRTVLAIGRRHWRPAVTPTGIFPVKVDTPVVAAIAVGGGRASH